jgi:hypothetical protein
VPCMMGVTGLPHGQVNCADVIVEVDYSLSTQPNIKETKKSRFLTSKGLGRWVEEPVDNPGLFCRDISLSNK